MAVQQVVPVTCPSCQTRFNAPIETIIDGQDVAMKSAFLQGQLNVTQCPQCGLTSPLGVPLLYYDLEKELAFVLVPGGLSMAGADQQRLIGDLTNKLVNSLPPENRKFYLLNPKQFLSLETMAKAILEADGITQEVLEAQAAKVKLIEEFLRAENENTLKKKVKEHDAELDKVFFELLTASIQAAQMEGNQAFVQTLFTLRTLLAKWSTQGKKVVEEIDAELGVMYLKSQEDLIERLKETKDDEAFEELVAAGYPLLDYGFFQKLTAQIDAAVNAKDANTANVLTNLRSKILEVKSRQEEKSRAALQKASELLRQVLQSGDPPRVLAEKLDEIDEAFFAVLAANIQEAQRQKQNQAVQTLELIGNMAMDLLQEQARAKTQVSQPAPTPQIHLPR
ncbi:MAG: hypothetical protein JXM69_11660 [Anaerolineae bacterium]|nr:hypothetical protein [Anaerolineae bacterium]